MSLKTLPFLLVNLGGEMIYILDQRLKAQSIPVDKAKKVLDDIVGTMFNKRFMEEVFKPQEIYNRKAIRTVFDRLAHASIMRLNAASMDKLYDLMTMAVKYQVTLCQKPNEILLVTLNHLDNISALVDDNHQVFSLVENVYRLLFQNYSNMRDGQFLLCRQMMLNYFQDVHIRVSIFLKEKSQHQNGKFSLPCNPMEVAYGINVPGSINIFDAKGKIAKTIKFHIDMEFKPVSKLGSTERKGNRVTKLGCNMYQNRTATNLESSVQPTKVTSSSEMDLEPPNPTAKAQLDLLSRLISGQNKTTAKPIKLSLFENEDDEQRAEAIRVSGDNSKIVNFDESKRQRRGNLDKIMGELNVQGASGDDDDEDLLDLMDRAK